MKRMKKIVSLALALIMALAMTATAFAADNHEHVITVTGNQNDKGTHTYEAYQIFAGDLADNPDYKTLTCNEEEGDAHTHSDECYTINNKMPKYVLSNIEWGSGVDGSGLLAALHTSGVNDSEAITAFKTKYAADLIDCKNAADVAAFISGFASSTANNSEDIDVFAAIVSEHLTNDYYQNGNGIDEDSTKIHVNGSGYYFIKDMDSSLGDQEDVAYTRFLLQVVGDATVVVKSEVPTGDKQIYVDGTTTNPDGTTTENLGDANNASVGAHVSYKITSHVPNHIGYNYYYFIMNDTLSEGLTFDGVDSLTVKVGNKTLVRGTDYYIYTHQHTDECYTKEADDESNSKLTCAEKDITPYTFRLAFADIMDYDPGEEIVVTYSATVNDKAIVGTTGNPNTWNLQYSNNPNDTFDGERPDGENTPGLPEDEENEPFGKTPEEKTLTYLTQIGLVKYANQPEEGNELAGATFTLKGISYQVVLKDVVYYEPDTEKPENNIYYKLLDGTYTTEAPTGTSYVEVGVGDFDTTTGYLLKDAQTDHDHTDECYYVPENTEEYNKATIYKRVNGNASNYSDVNVKYAQKTKEEISKVPVEVSIQKTTGSDGIISFDDLGEGTYILEETVTPKGYNTIDPIKFTISFEAPAKVTDGSEECTWTIVVDEDSENKTVNFSVQEGIFSTVVINQSGSLLPSTGGIGTTIFYVVGAILVIGAGILLVAKKRMSDR